MPDPRPNFLVFLVDQMQSAALGCHGNADARTPNMDALAAQGVTFRRAYCNNTVCMPSRASMVTGLTPRRHGCLTNGNSLPEHVPTITAALVDAGYRTHAVGKLHLQPFGGGARSWEDRERWNAGEITALPEGYYGFQTTDFVGGHVSYCFGDYANDIARDHPGLRERYARDAARPDDPHWRLDVPAELHYNHWIADRTIDFIQSAGDAPFFLQCSFPDPHFPYAAARPYNDMFDPAALALSPTWANHDDPCDFLAQRRRPEEQRFGNGFSERLLRECTAQTYGMITHVDDNIGRVMEALDEGGLTENTVVVFMADHGEYLGAHGLLYKDAWPYEELARVPFIWRFFGGPGAPPQGGRDDVVSLLDFAPTVLDFAGVDPAVLHSRGRGRSERDVLPGRSLRARIQGDDALPARPALIEFDEDWFPGPACRARVLVTDRWKLGVFGGTDSGLLFDLENDPHETRNLWSDPAHAATRGDLLARLLSELARTDRFDTPRISGA